MKTLFLVRHAKAVQNMLSLADIDRPLTERGFAEAHLMGKKLAAEKFRPELIVSSPGIRALSTALVFARNLSYPQNRVQIIESLFNASVEKLVNAIHQFDDTIERAMLFGHNPSITNIVNLLSDQYIEHIPTAGYCSISFSVDHWSEVSTRSGKLLSFEFPS